MNRVLSRCTGDLFESSRGRIGPAVTVRMATCRTALPSRDSDQSDGIYQYTVVIQAASGCLAYALADTSTLTLTKPCPLAPHTVSRDERSICSRLENC